jgi:hypothetical protein
MRPIKDAGWSRIREVAIFEDAPCESPQSFWQWVRQQEITTQRFAWFLLRIADASEVADNLEGFQAIGSSFDPDRIWLLDKEARTLMADFILDPSRYIA